MANTEGDKPVVHIIKKPRFKKPNKRQAIIGVVLIAALVVGGYFGYQAYQKHQPKKPSKLAEVPSKPLDQLEVTKVQATDPNIVNNAMATKRANGTVVSLSGVSLTVNINGTNKVYKLTDTTLYQTGDNYVDGKKEDVTAGKTVMVIYNDQTNEASTVWYE